MTTYEQFVHDLRYTLNHFYEPNLLRLNPLAGALAGARRPSLTPTALQQVLSEAIAALRPPATTPLRSQAWRTHNLLLHRYVQQFSQEEVAAQLGVSLRQLGREQSTALDALAGYLWDHYALGEKTRAAPGDTLAAEELARGAETTATQDPTATPQSSAAAQAGPGGAAPGLEPADPFADLSWLQNQPVQRPTDFRRELSTTLEIAQPLVAQNGARLIIADDPAGGELPGLAVHDVVLRELLLSVILAAIQHARGGQVELQAGRGRGDSQVVVEINCLTAPGAAALSDDNSNLPMAQQLAELSHSRLEISTTPGQFHAQLTLPVFELWTVLMVDDNRDLHELFQRYVAGTRYQVLGLSDPAQLLPLVEKTNPRAILLDVMMPHMDGWQLLGQLRQHPLTQGVPVVICTILAQKELAMSLGASHFLRKPVSQADLLLVLNQLAGAPAAGPH